MLGDPTNILKSFDLVIKGEVGFPKQHLQIIKPVHRDFPVGPLTLRLGKQFIWLEKYCIYYLLCVIVWVYLQCSLKHNLEQMLHRFINDLFLLF